MLNPSKVKIAVLVSGGGTNLQALLENERAGMIPDGKIELVLSNNPNAYALTRAENFGVKAVCVSKQDYPDFTTRENKMIEVLKENGILVWLRAKPETIYEVLKERWNVLEGQAPI